MARAAFQSSELDTALEHSETALSKIESIRGNIKQQDLKTTFFASLHSYYDLEIQILAAMDRVHPNEGYSWKAFLVAERARARTLLDEVAATNKDPQASPALLAQYDDVRRRLRQLETSSSHPHAPGTSRTQAKMARLSMEEHALHAEIAKDGATTAAPDIKPLTLMSLQTALPDAHAALNEYWTGEDASYAWSTTRSGIQFFRLPPAAQLNQLINGFRRAVFAMVPSDPKITAEQRVVSRTAAEGQQHRLGLRLMKMLFPIGMLHPAASTVLIVGDGAIHSLPFAALPDQAARQSQSPRRIVFINEPSATLFAALTSGSIAPHSLRAAIFMANDAAHVEQVRSSFVLLPFAANEAETIRTILGANATRIFTGPAASAEAMRNLDWHDFSIGHFATHAVLNAQYAELTGLQLGKDSTAQSTASQMLWYGDILRMRARLDLVVLSACETALGKDVPGEGLVGLTQAFFTAGSQRVVGTLWQVDDQATSEWMRHFYQSLKKTRSPATALHDAQKAMAADPQWSAPYYWAGFVLAGDWRPLP